MQVVTPRRLWSAATGRIGWRECTREMVMAKKNTVKDLQRLVAKAKKAHERMSAEVAEAQRRVIRLAEVLVKLEASLAAQGAPASRPAAASRAKRGPAAAKRRPRRSEQGTAKQGPGGEAVRGGEAGSRDAGCGEARPAKRATTAKRAPRSG